MPGIERRILIFFSQLLSFNLKYGVVENPLSFGDILNRFCDLLIILILFTQLACHKAKPVAVVPADPQVENLKGLIARAHYEEAANQAKTIASQVAHGQDVSEILYLESYALMFGEKDYGGARAALKQLLDFFPQSPHAIEAQQWIADCHYWDSNYDRALREYRKLEGAGKDAQTYAFYQEANCLLLKDKVGDALTTYRNLIEKYPGSPLADSAQLMVANTYLKLDDRALAKTELQKFMSMTKNPALLHSAQKALDQLEEAKSSPKGPGENH